LLENCCTGSRAVGSNPTLSAISSCLSATARGSSRRKQAGQIEVNAARLGGAALLQR